MRRPSSCFASPCPANQSVRLDEVQRLAEVVEAAALRGRRFGAEEARRLEPTHLDGAVERRARRAAKEEQRAAAVGQDRHVERRHARRQISIGGGGRRPPPAGGDEGTGPPPDSRRRAPPPPRAPLRCCRRRAPRAAALRRPGEWRRRWAAAPRLARQPRSGSASLPPHRRRRPAPPGRRVTPHPARGRARGRAATRAQALEGAPVLGGQASPLDRRRADSAGQTSPERKTEERLRVVRADGTRELLEGRRRSPTDAPPLGPWPPPSRAPWLRPKFQSAASAPPVVRVVAGGLAHGRRDRFQ